MMRLTSRRQLIQRSVTGVLGIGLAIPLLVAHSAVRARVDPAPDPALDSTILNGLLGLEFDADGLYNQAIARLSDDITAGPGTTRGQYTFQLRDLEIQHERTRAALTLFIRGLGGDPVTVGTGMAPAVNGSGYGVFADVTAFERFLVGRYVASVQELTTAAAASLVGSIACPTASRAIGLLNWPLASLFVGDLEYVSYGRCDWFNPMPMNCPPLIQFVLDAGVAGSRTYADDALLDAELAFDPAT